MRMIIMLQGYKFCSFCGSGDIARNGRIFTCQSCHKTTYINCSTACGCIFYNDRQEILLAERKYDPWKGKYDDVGGFMDIDDQCVEDTVMRETYEELGIHINKADLVYVGSASIIYHQDGRDTPVTAIICMSYLSQEQINKIQATDDVAVVKWFTKKSFDPAMMYSDGHIQAVYKIFDQIGV